MRCWHYLLLPYLPKSQLLAQKRECDLIWKDIANGEKTNHILINYIWEYEDYETELSIYYRFLKDEFKKRGYNFKSHKYAYMWVDNFLYPALTHPFENHHNRKYLLQCFMNLSEKYFRKQCDFDQETYDKLYNFVNKELNNILDDINNKL